jgi:hypothetical protein
VAQPPAQMAVQQPQAPVAATRIEPREPREIAVAKETPASSRNQDLLWIITGGVLAAGLGTGGYLLYRSTRTASTATINVTWSQ